MVVQARIDDIKKRCAVMQEVLGEDRGKSDPFMVHGLQSVVRLVRDLAIALEEHRK